MSQPTTPQGQQPQQSTQALVQKQDYDNAKSMMTKMLPTMAAVLPKHVTPERMLKVFLTAFQKVPDLAKCDRLSIIAAVMDASETGLPPDGKRAALIPRKIKGVLKAQFQPMYQGVLELARNSGEIKDVEVRTVYEGDEFSYAYGLNPHLTHSPKGTSFKPTHTYCIIRLKEGGVQWKVMSWGEILKVKEKFSKASDGPWNDALGQIAMGEKTVFLRTAKWAPVSRELERALDADERAEDNRDLELDPSLLEEVLSGGLAPKKLEDLTQKITGQTAAPEAPKEQVQEAQKPEPAEEEPPPPDDSQAPADTAEKAPEPASAPPRKAGGKKKLW